MDPNETEVEYNAVIADLEERLANIESEKHAIEAKEATLRTLIASHRKLQALESGDSPPPSTNEVVVPKRAFKNSKTMIAACKKYLSIAETGQTTRQISDGLLKGGFPTKSRFLTANVRTALHRQGSVNGIVAAKGLWWLAEWSYTPQPTVEEVVKDIEARIAKGESHADIVNQLHSLPNPVPEELINQAIAKIAARAVEDAGRGMA
jgi:hypothetical protein